MTRKLSSNIAQIMLVILCLPCLAIIFQVLDSGGASSFDGMVGAFLSNVPICEIWVDILNQSYAGLTEAQFIETLPVVFMRAVPEALLLAVSVHASNQFFRVILRQRGLPIISTLVGVAVSYLLTDLSGKIANLFLSIGAELIMVVGIILVFRTVFHRRRLRIFGIHRVLLIVIDGLLALISTAYVAYLCMIFRAQFASPQKAFGGFMIVSGILLLASVLACLITQGDDAYV